MAEQLTQTHPPAATTESVATWMYRLASLFGALLLCVGPMLTWVSYEDSGILYVLGSSLAGVVAVGAGISVGCLTVLRIARSGDEQVLLRIQLGLAVFVGTVMAIQLYLVANYAPAYTGAGMRDVALGAALAIIGAAPAVTGLFRRRASSR